MQSLAEYLASIGALPQTANTDPNAATAPTPQPPQPSDNAQAPIDPNTLHGRALAQLAQMQPQVDSTPLAPQPSLAATALSNADVMSAPASQTLGNGAVPMPSDATGQTLDQQNIANAGFSNVPQFQAAPDLVEHHGWLSSALSAVGHGVQKFSQAYGDRLANIDPEIAKTLTPAQLQAARSTAIFQDGLGTLDRQPDAQGFMPSTLQSLAKGMGVGRQAGQQAAQGSLQANQYLAQVATQRQLVQGRQQIAQQYAFNPADTQQQQLQKLDGAAQAYMGIGDDKAASAAASAAKSLRESTHVTPQPRPDQMIKGIMAPAGAVGPDGQPVKPGTVSTLGINGATGQHTYYPEGKIVDPAADARAADVQGREDDRLLESQSKALEPYRVSQNAYGHFQAIGNQAMAGNTASVKAFPMEFANVMQAAGAKNGARGMAAAKMLGQLDPSLIGRAESLFDGTFDGTMSQTQIKSALKVADALNNENVASGTRAITTWQRQHPKLAARGVQANEIFPASMATGSTNAPTASKFWKP